MSELAQDKTRLSPQPATLFDNELSRIWRELCARPGFKDAEAPKLPLTAHELLTRPLQTLVNIVINSSQLSIHSQVRAAPAVTFSQPPSRPPVHRPDPNKQIPSQHQLIRPRRTMSMASIPEIAQAQSPPIQVVPEVVPQPRPPSVSTWSPGSLQTHSSPAQSLPTASSATTPSMVSTTMESKRESLLGPSSLPPSAFYKATVYVFLDGGKSVAQADIFF
jgi:hypothetical protein